MKEHVNVPVPQKSDVGQLLFYMLGTFIVNSDKNEQQQLGIYIGEHVSYYLNDNCIKGHLEVVKFGISIAHSPK